ncbi:medium-chain acyl-CoA ligase ACSF2, mitochondrial-like isoform X2 [Corticium candelabrum]|uniref:medium-chain acyl-CoA ligase ACSF2, mitochondrial-like isoform X2 n=1 Tax=Corticium candelabrum TaxID=121492 RepID=UPI002E25C538|nr:medium-chain acyl-CoA ligase ACSF2, mitochondrial-like isoform X2 [Corticium candelabrum]
MRFFRCLATTCARLSDCSISYRHGTSNVPLLGETIGQRLDDVARKHPSREALVVRHQHIRRSYAEFNEEVNQLAASFLALGLKKGERVGIWGPNSHEWVLTQFATAKAGLILVNINPAYRPLEAKYALEKVGCKALVSAPKFRSQHYYEILCSIIPNLRLSSPGHLQTDKLPELKTVIMTGQDRFDGTLQFEEVIKMGSSHEHNQLMELTTQLKFDDPINIQFTSGTTGNPKGATLSHHNILNNAYFVGLALGYNDQETRVCIPVPLYHCFGMVLGMLNCIVHGACAVLPSGSFEADAVLKTVEEERIHSLYGTPTMFIDMLNHPDFSQYDLSSLYTGIMAGSPCPIEVMKRVISNMNMEKVTICYGLTESSPVTFQTSPEDPLEQRVSTVGKAHPHTEAKVIDDNDCVVKLCVPGELCTRGYSTMLGYWNDDEKTKETITVEGWLKTGDVAVMDDDGYVTVVGRKKDVVIRGGENLYPTEIEQFLYKHPKIQDVQIIGVPDDRLGEELCACIILKSNEEATIEDIREFCRDEIAYMKVPRYVVFVDSFPMTVTGKIQKFRLREQMAKQLEL